MNKPSTHSSTLHESYLPVVGGASAQAGDHGRALSSGECSWGSRGSTKAEAVTSHQKCFLWQPSQYFSWSEGVEDPPWQGQVCGCTLTVDLGELEGGRGGFPGVVVKLLGVVCVFEASSAEPWGFMVVCVFFSSCLRGKLKVQLLIVMIIMWGLFYGFMEVFNLLHVKSSHLYL